MSFTSLLASVFVSVIIIPFSSVAAVKHDTGDEICARRGTSMIQISAAFKAMRSPRNSSGGGQIRVTQTAKDNSSQAKWKAWYPSWEAQGLKRSLYDDNGIEQVVQEVVPHLFDKFQLVARDIEKADFFRFAILYRDGGVYADLDQELVNATLLKELVRSGRVYLPQEKTS